MKRATHIFYLGYALGAGVNIAISAGANEWLTIVVAVPFFIYLRGLSTRYVRKSDVMAAIHEVANQNFGGEAK